MTYSNIQNLPQPAPVQKFIGLDISYGGGTMQLDCLGLSVVRLLHPPEYPDIECIHARAVQAELGPKLVETALYIVPLEYITKIDMVALPTGLTFLPPMKKFLISLDQSPATGRMTAKRIKDVLAELGVSI